MAFLQPALLFALPAVLIPLIIHLLHRRRFQEKSWGAMRFLREALEEKRGRRKIRHWLVLALRMLAVAMLVLAMSRPLVGGWLAGWGGGGDRSVILLMDRSASMERRLASGETKRQRALQTLTETLDKATPSELWLGSRPVADLDRLPDQLGATDAGADLPSMLLEAFQLWQNTNQTRGEIWMISDLQASSWRSEDNAAWADVQAAYRSLEPSPRLRFLTLPGGQPNRAIQCEADRRQLHVRILQDTNASATIPLTIKRGEQTTREEISLTGETTTLTFAMSEDAVVGSVALPEDGNARDNVAHFAFDAATPARIAVVCEDASVEAILELAASPRGLAEITYDATWEEEALVLWQGTPPSNRRIESYLERGGQLLLFPSVDATAQAFEPGAVIATWSRDEGPLRDTSSGESLALSQIQTFLHIPVAGRALATLGNGETWLSLQDKTYHCSTLPLDAWSTLGEGAVLVPLLQRLIAAGEKSLSKVRQVPVREEPWQAGISQRDDGVWEIKTRPQDEDLPTELEGSTIANLLGDVPYQEFALEETAGTEEAVSEWWRPFLWFGLLFLLLEGLFTRMPVKRQPSATT